MLFVPIILFSLVRFGWCDPPGVQFVVNMISQLESCDEVSDAAVDTSGVVVGRYNETIAYMRGNVKFLIDVGAETMVEMLLYKEANNKYELMFSHEICDLCAEVAKGEDSDYISYMKYFGIPSECPFDAGEYPILEFIVDTDDLPVNSNTVGRYQAYLNLYKNPEKDCKSTKIFMFCLSLKLIIEAD
ncbi:uncharacterized protein LOC118270605 [Spodoptera frugiperda]|uniref:Uncharacterized protein LOC118270605 n=1 Tax=Spodoptera frugiperda TaxID=7108 RepID=A0A9R0D6M0_SPOFR|nr:uncharacterized protein LOC118270605 [Spodoptera frugiperda]